jgi:hypothetical protein
VDTIGPVDRQGFGTAIEGEGLDQAEDAQEMVGVPVGD